MTERTRAELVYRAIRRRIVSLDLQPGTLLTESQLASELGVSKTPVREALRHLQADGLVELSRGTYSVSAVTLQDIRDYLALREVLEVGAVRLAAGRASRDQLPKAVADTLLRLSGVTYDPSDRDDEIRFLDVDQEFHVAIGSASGNRRLAMNLETVLMLCQRVTQLGTVHSSGASHLNHDHVELAQAIVGGHEDEAVELARGAARNREKNITEAILTHPAILATNLVSPDGRGSPRGNGHGWDDDSGQEFDALMVPPFRIPAGSAD